MRDRLGMKTCQDCGLYKCFCQCGWVSHRTHLELIEKPKPRRIKIRLTPTKEGNE